MRPLLIVVSAPSGAGKTTLCDRLLAECDSIVYSISCTTRRARGAEQDGKDYFFLSEVEFQKRIEGGEFLEHALVHGYRYGTLKKTITDALSSDRTVLMDIDVQGAGQIRSALSAKGRGGILADAFVDLFVTAPSIAELRSRLEGRGEDSAEVIDSRMAIAEEEMNCSESYMYVIVNDDLDRAYDELREIVKKEMMSDK